MKFPRWLSWLFVLFIGYMLYAGYNPLKPPAAELPAATTLTETPDYPAIRALVDGQRWAKAINPTYKPEPKPCAAPEHSDKQLPFYAIITQEGTGPQAACGDTIALEIAVWNAQGERGKPIAQKAFTLGKQPGLDALLIALQEGETRRVFFTTPAAGYASLPALPKARLVVVDISRPAPPAAK